MCAMGRGGLSSWAVVQNGDFIWSLFWLPIEGFNLEEPLCLQAAGEGLEP